MKRLILTAGLVAAASFAPVAPASANHLCITSEGETIICQPHPKDLIPTLCVSADGQDIICFG